MSNPRDGTAQSSTLLRASAEGVKFLVLLQITSRLLTFIVNQILLRYLSPELLGISVQFELYMITILYFSRESLRTAVQRYSITGFSQNDAKSVSQNNDKATRFHSHPSTNEGLIEGSPAAQSQTVINLAYISIPLGILFSAILAPYYINTFAPTETTSQPHFYESVVLYTLATTIELCSEPCFALSQQHMLYKLRAAAESAAALIRCILTCGLTIYAARTGLGGRNGIGPLPFAVGQFGYSLVLTCIYVGKCLGIAKTGGFSMGLKGIRSSTDNYHLGYFHTFLSSIAFSMWMQASIKHVLTQGDSLLIAWLATTYDQGIYALASNYGSLIARMLFQPLEESTRNLFAKLLSQTSESSQNKGKSTEDSLSSSVTILQIMLKFYAILSLFFIAFGAPLAPLLLRIVAGSRWSESAAGSVLASFCYYIPLLAVNGITEGFVQSVASSKKLHQQSIWMFVFSLGFGIAGYVFLRELGWGAQGLVWANCVNMGLRIVWSWMFIKSYYKENGVRGISLSAVIPDWRLVSTTVLFGAIMRSIDGLDSLSLRMIAKIGTLGVLLLAICAGTERRFFMDCYQLMTSR